MRIANWNPAGYNLPRRTGMATVTCMLSSKGMLRCSCVGRARVKWDEAQVPEFVGITSISMQGLQQCSMPAGSRAALLTLCLPQGQHTALWRCPHTQGLRVHEQFCGAASTSGLREACKKHVSRQDSSRLLRALLHVRVQALLQQQAAQVHNECMPCMHSGLPGWAACHACRACDVMQRQLAITLRCPGLGQQ
jgi:hypothetical protein